MAFDYLLRPGRINRMQLPTRIITGPMEKGLANRDGSLTQRYIDYLLERARGGASLIQVESTYVDVRGLGHLFQVGCHGDHVIPALARMAQAVHAEGAKVGLELYLGGRQTPAYMSQRQPLAPSATSCTVLHPAPMAREMTLADIEQVIGAFAAAARRVREAGLDMIHLHGAHGYLLCAFLSPFTNTRTDKYGGTAANRARFPLEVLAAVRQIVGPDFPIGYRMSAEEYVEGGLTVADTAAFSVMLADAGIDLIDVSGGIYESFPMIIQGPEAPAGGFVRNAAVIKAAVGDRAPVSVAQRLNDPYFADQVLRREGLDFISLTRAFHADPEYLRKVAENRVDEIVPCIACHHCTNLLEANLPTGCSVNPRSGHERERRIHPAAAQRNVLIVGGGPAGLQAARILAEEGHRVTVHEASGELGGQMRYSSRVMPDYGKLTPSLAAQLRKLKVEIRLDSHMDAAGVERSGAEVIVIATGASGGLRLWPVKEGALVFDLFSAMDRPLSAWKNKVVIAGGDSESCFVAIHLARGGVEVHVIEPGAVFSANKMSPGRELLMMAVGKLPAIHLHPETTIEEVGGDNVLLQKHGVTERLSDVGGVVAGGRVANNQLYEELIARQPHLEVYNIGDSVSPRDVYSASAEAAGVAELIRSSALDAVPRAASRAQ